MANTRREGNQRQASPLRDDGGASEYLDMSARTLQRWRLEGRGPRYVKLGKLVRYRTEDLDEFIQQQLRGGAAA